MYTSQDRGTLHGHAGLYIYIVTSDFDLLKSQNRNSKRRKILFIARIEIESDVKFFWNYLLDNKTATSNSIVRYSPNQLIDRLDQPTS